MARPSKLTAQATERIVQAIKAGNYAEAACRSAGIGVSTFYRWLERGEREKAGPYHAFAEEVRRAEADAEVHAVAILRRAMPDDWRAAIAYLERRYPGRWRKRTTTELVGKDGEAIRTEAVHTLDVSRLTDEELALIQQVYARAVTSE